jgi:hypothetical protein
MSKAPLERLSAADEARAKAVPPVEVAPHGDFDESDDEFDEDYSHTRRLQPILVCVRCHYKARAGFGMGIRDHLARKYVASVGIVRHGLTASLIGTTL